jgi:hypothetical protein
MAQEYQYIRYIEKLPPGILHTVIELCISGSQTIEVRCDSQEINFVLEDNDEISKGARLTGPTDWTTIATSSYGVTRKCRLFVTNCGTNLATFSVRYSCADAYDGTETTTTTTTQTSTTGTGTGSGPMLSMMPFLPWPRGMVTYAPARAIRVGPDWTYWVTGNPGPANVGFMTYKTSDSLFHFLYISSYYTYDILTDTWTEIATTGTKPSYEFPTVYDPDGNRFIVCGSGEVGSGVWTLDLSSHVWTKLTTSGSSPFLTSGVITLSNHSVFYVSPHGLVVVGGQPKHSANSLASNIYLLDLSTNVWQVMSASGPSGFIDEYIYDLQIVPDLSRNRVVVLGGKKTSINDQEWPDYTPLGIYTLSTTQITWDVETGYSASGSLVWDLVRDFGNNLYPDRAVNVVYDNKIYAAAGVSLTGTYTGTGVGIFPEVRVFDLADDLIMKRTNVYGQFPDHVLMAGNVSESGVLFTTGGFLVQASMSDSSTYTLDLTAVVLEDIPDGPYYSVTYEPVEKTQTYYLYGGGAWSPSISSLVFFGGEDDNGYFDCIGYIPIDTGLLNRLICYRADSYVGNAPESRSHPRLLCDGNVVYVYGGTSNSSGLWCGDLFTFDLGTVTWSQVSCVDLGTTHNYAYVKDSTTLIFVSEEVPSDVHVVDLNANTCTLQTTTGGPQSYDSFDFIGVSNDSTNDLCYVLYWAWVVSSSCYQLELWTLDTNTNSWNQLTPRLFPDPELFNARSMYWHPTKSKIIVYGTYRATYVDPLVPTFFVYDIETDTWSIHSSSNPPNSIMEFATCMIDDGRLVTYAGNDSSYNNTVELWISNEFNSL